MRGCGYQDVARHGQAFRDRIVARLLPLESAAIDVVSREVGVSVGMLERWRAQALAAPGELASSQRWTPAARLEAGSPRRRGRGGPQCVVPRAGAVPGRAWFKS